MMGVGSRVLYRNGDDETRHGARYPGEDRGIAAGVYTIVDTDDYVMCGMVEIEGSDGQRWGIDASLLRLHPSDPGWPYDKETDK